MRWVRPGPSMHGDDGILKLLALDREDLEVVSAHMQDASSRSATLPMAPRVRAVFRRDQPLRLGNGRQEGQGFERRARLSFQARSVRPLRRHSTASDRKRCCRCWPSASSRRARGPKATIELALAGDGYDRARCGMHRGAACGYRRSMGNRASSRAIPRAVTPDSLPGLSGQRREE